MTAELLLDAARRIGRHLCAEAVFERTGQRCNWMGRQNVEDVQAAGHSVCAAALGPDLYGGSAGVALFLAELYGRTGDEAARQTARAAMRRSVYQMRHHPPNVAPFSFFTGHLGLAYAASRLMELDPEADLAADLAWLTDSMLDERTELPPLDVINGCAGAIPPLLLLARRPGLERLAAVALRLGEEICRSAIRENGLCRWEPARLAGVALPSPPVTGFSHGVSGPALALLALYAQTGTDRYRAMAREAFAFEDSLYSEADRNWVDTRAPYVQEGGRVKGAFQAAWCHGAPGIALARTVAAALDPTLKAELQPGAAAGLQTTATAIAERLAAHGNDATLCHGIAGLSEVMLTGGALVDPAYRELAVETALALVRRYGAAGGWPSGVRPSGPNPSLMVGTAGIGYHLLRLTAAEQVPSILSLLL